MPRVSSMKSALTALLPNAVYCPLVTLQNSLRGYDLKIEPVPETNHFVITHSGQSLTIARRNRYWYYKRGIHARLETLGADYELSQVSLSPGDRVVDCGANIGEFGVWVKQFDVDYIAFEPEQLEAECCDINVYDGAKKTHRLGLWCENTTLKFYSKPDSADGSLIETNDYAALHQLEVVTLASHFGEEAKKGIRLFKVEAEGAEPEVLQGALPILEYIDYISVDCGYERGIDNEPTFIEVNELLTQNNFELISQNSNRMVFLFKRRDCAT